MTLNAVFGLFTSPPTLNFELSSLEALMLEAIGCPGFEAAGMAAGIKKSGAFDLGLIRSSLPAVAAGVFTRNRVQAAPVLVSKTRVAKGTARAVVVNSGNANCYTGEQGVADAQAMAALAAAELNLAPEDVLVASTGVIGAPFPIQKIATAVPALAAGLGAAGFESFSRAIMTTDKVPKLVQRRGEIDGLPITLVAAAKGSGMIRPDMATMLCFVCTDARISASLLQQNLKSAVDRTLNRITIDGDTSTNDMVLILANGASTANVQTPDQQQVFQALLSDLLSEIAYRLVKDGEGVTKVARIIVQGAASDADAWRIADTVAHSPLVKTAFFGEDANWGRIIAAVGRAGVPLEPQKIDLFFGQVQIVHQGRWCGSEAESRATAVLKQDEFTVTIDLHQGQGTDSLLTCDFSLDYVKINADYRT
jgi:glutamate N-acetyltransferase / amino-acid N-acetyltransferase